MGLRAQIKIAELGLGLGTAVWFLWMPLSLVLATGLASLGLGSPASARLLAATCSGVGLIVAMALAGVAGGLLLTTGRWALSTTVLVVAVAFRATIHLLSQEPLSPWSGAGEAAIWLGSMAAGLLAAVGCFGWIQHRLARRQPRDPGPPGSGRSDRPPVAR